MARFGRTLERIGRTEIRSITATSQTPRGALFTPTWPMKGQPLQEQFTAESAISGAYAAEIYCYKSVQVISNLISALPLRVGRDPFKPKSFDPAAPMAQLLSIASLGSPNPQWSCFQLMKYALMQYVVCGKTAWLKERDQYTGDLVGLWPLSVQYLKPVPSYTGDQYFSLFQYGQKGSPNYQEFTPDEIVYIWSPSLSDPRQPETVIQAAQLPISVVRAVDMMENAFFKNNAVPATIVATREFADDEDARAWQEQFDVTFGGYQNAGKTMHLEVSDNDAAVGGTGVAGAVSVTRIGSNFKEMDLSGLKEDLANKLIVAFGIPMSCLGDSSDSRYQTSPTDRRDMWLNTLGPKASEFADHLNLRVAPLFDDGNMCWFDFSAVAEMVPPAMFKPENAVDMVANNLLTRDEVRSDYGLPPWIEVDPEDTPFGVAPGVAVSTMTIADPGGAISVPPPVVLPVEQAVARSSDMLAAARARRERRRQTRADDGEGVWHTNASDSKSGPCPECADLDGTTTSDQPPLHPQCVCDWEPSERASRVGVRHAGPNHDHITSGHTTKTSVERALTAAMRKTMKDQAAESAKRLSGQRGAKRAADSLRDVSALYDAPYWTGKATAEFTPVLGAARAAEEARTMVADITSALTGVLGRVAPNDLPPAVADVFDSYGGASIPAAEVEQQLLNIYRGASQA